MTSGGKLRWTTVFVFTSLVLYAIMGILLAGFMIWKFYWFFLPAIAYIGFIFAGVSIIERFGK